MADPRIVRAIPALAELAEAFLEHPKSAPTLHVTWTLSGLDVDVTGVERRSGGLSADAQMRAIAAAGRADLARLSLAGETLVMARQPQVGFGPATVPLPAGGFLQAVREAEAAMVSRAVEAVRGAKKVADLFCGAGTFTFPLATVAPVIAADASKAGIEALKEGKTGPEPVRSRFGWHVLRLQRRIEGRTLPFEIVRERIADMLEARSWSLAAARYVAGIAAGATIEGVVIAAEGSR